MINVGVRAGFAVTSLTVTVDDLAARIGLVPDIKQNRGELLHPERPGGVPAPFHRWELASSLSPFEDAEAHIDHILDRLTVFADAIGRLEDVGAELWLAREIRYVESNDSIPGLSLSVRVVTELARMKASLDVDDYVFLQHGL